MAAVHRYRGHGTNADKNHARTHGVRFPRVMRRTPGGVMINATFVMEQHLGHQTYYQNLQQEVDLLSQIQATWVPVIYPQLTPFWERMPQKLQHVRGTLVARAHVRKHIQRAASNIMFFNTQVPA